MSLPDTSISPLAVSDVLDMLEQRYGGSGMTPRDLDVAKVAYAAAISDASKPDLVWCAACSHFLSLHDPRGCLAKIYPSGRFPGNPCPCEHPGTAPVLRPSPPKENSR
jgi:hypothetical protein